METIPIASQVPCLLGRLHHGCSSPLLGAEILTLKLLLKETPTQRKKRRSCKDRGQETRSCSMTGRNSQGVPNPESDILWVAFQRPTHLKNASVVSATAPPSHRESQEWKTCANDGLMVLFSLPPQVEKWTMLKGSLFKYLENRQINVLMPSFTHTVQPHAC
jgi:hypothetical protein